MSWDPWGKKFFHNCPVVPEDEFNVAIVTPVIHYCMGGLEIDVHKECTRRVSAPAHEARRQPTPPRTRAAAWDWARREGRRRRT